MSQLYIILALVFLLCFTIYQWWFQSSRFKQMADPDQAKVKAYNKPRAWALYSIGIFLVLLTLISYNIMKLMQGIMSLDI